MCLHIYMCGVWNIWLLHQLYWIILGPKHWSGWAGPIPPLINHNLTNYYKTKIYIYTCGFLLNLSINHRFSSHNDNLSMDFFFLTIKYIHYLWIYLFFFKIIERKEILVEYESKYTKIGGPIILFSQLACYLSILSSMFHSINTFPFSWLILIFNYNYNLIFVFFYYSFPQ